MSTEDTAPQADNNDSPDKTLSTNIHELLDYAWELITEAPSDEMLNPLLCGYFTKLMLGLLENKKNEFLAYLGLSSGKEVKSRDLVKSLIDHIYDRSIAELVSKVIIASQGVFSMAQAMEMDGLDDEISSPNTGSQEAIAQLVDKLIEGKYAEDSLNAALVLTDLCNNGDGKTQKIMSEPECMDKL